MAGSSAAASIPLSWCLSELSLMAREQSLKNQQYCKFWKSLGLKETEWGDPLLKRSPNLYRIKKKQNLQQMLTLRSKLLLIGSRYKPSWVSKRSTMNYRKMKKSLRRKKWGSLRSKMITLLMNRWGQATKVKKDTLKSFSISKRWKMTLKALDQLKWLPSRKWTTSSPTW